MYKGMGGFGGGNMQNLMRQAQKMQEEMEKNLKEVEEKLAETVLTSTVGGMVTIEMFGNKQVKSVIIKPEAVDSSDMEMLEDMVTACINDAIKKATDLEKSLKANNNIPNIG